MTSSIASSETGFLQPPPELRNQFLEDDILRSIISFYLPQRYQDSVQNLLVPFGDFVVSPQVLSSLQEADATPPFVTHYDAWGRRVDMLVTSAAWKFMKNVACKEGIVSIAYEGEFDQWSRFIQFVKYYLFSPSSAVFTCPLAMTDGGARLLELFGTGEMKQNYLPHLLSRDPSYFWTSGQWMTERPGGSFLGDTETVATCIDRERNLWKIDGFKWFSSATDSDITFLLARTKSGRDYINLNSPPPGGLSLFVAKLRDANGELNGIRVQRLKKKLGTLAVPTAELELKGMEAQMIGPEYRGIPVVSTILNITRVHCAIGAVSFMRRAKAIAHDWAFKRRTGDKLIYEHPLHTVVMASLHVKLSGCMHLVFFVVFLLGQDEWNQRHSIRTLESKNLNIMLRLLTPITKSWVCESSVSYISTCMECLGGQGYMEEVGIARLLRDAQVNTIWEGTSSILALDVLRVIKETKGTAIEVFKTFVLKRLQNSLSASSATKADLNAGSPVI
ncbi:acyl-CoA dehydrogenase/oxidase C-terminal [Conidiobolus coronatus NRRL 28638]|uniref:Acyl-CoA dehydrogenase/oxidase C-terminal n=1 Tax=Conidiobolus coronatus (strain ATCC 28846 / CBS 209.66 / NRRL 28638) TaxID=796925 RepID=A0A137NZP0_CONC2|nr:acyl-CoA dehydrogenase/oxidase C-terminal [Conidiobolus coronatus NRRL 28638]|eukprot:KXN68049.1 acyl-CoA dehydrogenase/oxidase C-terminal [Conidiobolus coronatus NRRL 28638]